MAASAAQAISSVKVVQALALESIFEKEFAGSSRQDLQEGVKGQRLAARLERSMDVLTAMATALVSKGWRYGHNLLHFSFPHAEHDEAAWGVRLHLPMQFLNGAVARASRARAPVLG